MLRTKNVIATAAVLVVSAGILAPVAQAKGDGLTVNPLTTTTVSPAVPVHDTPLANPVDPNVVVTGRTAPTSGGIDWTFPVMGAVALGLIIMVAGDQILVRRRGQLAT